MALVGRRTVEVTFAAGNGDESPSSCVYHLRSVISHTVQLSLLLSVGWEISTSQSVVIPYGWGVKAVMAHSSVD